MQRTPGTIVITITATTLILPSLALGAPIDFSPLRTVAADGAPRAITLADVDGDGTTDLITISTNAQGDGVLRVLPGGSASCAWNGFGSSPLALVAIGPDPVSVAAGHLDGDGHVDLVVADAQAHELLVLRGNGDGSFDADPAVSLPASPQDVVIGHFSGDGTPDLAVALADARVRVLRGDGAGSFLPPRDFSLPGALGGTMELDPEDFDEDGIQDLACAQSANGRVSVVYLAQDGSETSRLDLDLPSDGGTTPAPVDLTVLDVDGNGVRDIITANANGSGTLSCILDEGAVIELMPIGTLADAVASGDFDGDCDLDLMIVSGSSVKLLVNTGAGFAAPVTISTGGAATAALATHDLDADGRADFVVGRTDATLVGRRGAPCPDLNCDGMTDLDDLLALFSAWGPCGDCREDLNGDGQVGTMDMLMINSAWGACAPACAP